MSGRRKGEDWEEEEGKEWNLREYVCGEKGHEI